MALNRENLAKDLKDVFEETRNNTGSETDSLEYFVGRLSDVLIAHIKTLDIKYTNGLMAPNGAVTGHINHTVE